MGLSIQEGLPSEGYLSLRFGGFIFERADFWRGLLSEHGGRLLGLFLPHLSKLRVLGYRPKYNASNVMKLGREIGG